MRTRGESELPMRSRTAPANLVPSRGEVPRPSSSTNTNDLGPEQRNRAAKSPISAPKALLSSDGTSADAPLKNKVSKRDILDSEERGAQKPHTVSKAAAAADLIKVDFPDMLGAVKRIMEDKSNVLETALDLSIQ